MPVRLGDICKIETGKLNANSKEEDGKYPFFTCDITPSRINTFAFDTNAILISGNGNQVGHINMYSGKFNAYQRTYVLNEFDDSISERYLYFYLKAFFKNYVLKKSKKGSIPYITLPMLKEFTIPFPLISAQEKIVHKLDKFELVCNSLTDGIPAEIQKREKQYEYYRDILLTFKNNRLEKRS